MTQAGTQLDRLKALTAGRPEVVVGMIDGPVNLDHPDLSARVSRLGDGDWMAAPPLAVRHGTFIAGILAARRDSAASGICPDCTLLVRALSGISASANGVLSLSSDELGAAIVACIDSGARIINLSLEIAPLIGERKSAVADALDLAAARGVLVIAASGNDAGLRDSQITAHPWIIPVISHAADGRPSGFATTSPSIGRRGVGAPGENVRGLDGQDGHVTLSGTSAAAAFVTGAAALLRSLFPQAALPALKAALVAQPGRRRSLFPPALDAWAAYVQLART